MTIMEKLRSFDEAIKSSRVSTAYYLSKDAERVEKMIQNVWRSSIKLPDERINISGANEHEVMCLRSFDCRELGNGSCGYDPTGKYIIISRRTPGDPWTAGSTIPKFAVEKTDFFYSIKEELKVENGKILARVYSAGEYKYVPIEGQIELFPSREEFYDALGQKCVVNKLRGLIGASCITF